MARLHESNGAPVIYGVPTLPARAIGSTCWRVRAVRV